MMTPSDSELLPCPVCKKSPWGLFGPSSDGECVVECHSDGCGYFHFFGTREETATAWNRFPRPGEGQWVPKEPYWLIERNSKHKNMPLNEHVMWFKERICRAGGDVDIWTPHADKARHFTSKFQAEEYVRDNLTGDDYNPAPDVTDHIDCNGPVPPSDEAAPSHHSGAVVDTECSYCGSLRGGHTLACQAINEGREPAQIPAGSRNKNKPGRHPSSTGAEE